MASVSALAPPGFSTTWATAPDDGTQIKASHIRQLAQIALTNDAFLKAVLDELGLDVAAIGANYIIGNGEPPAAGYTPTVRPIEIKGQGLAISTTLALASAIISGDHNVTGKVVASGRHARNGGTATDEIRFSNIIATNDTPISTTADVWRVKSLVGNRTYTMLDVDGQGPQSVRLRSYDMAAATSFAIIREGAGPPSTIITVVGPAAFTSVEVEWDGARWRLGDYTSDGTVTLGADGGY